jgi:Yip1-like protein
MRPLAAISVAGEPPHLMTNATVPTGGTLAPKSLPARFVGIITSPRATYESVVAHPKWFGMLAVVAVGMAVLIGGFLATKVGQDAWIDAAVNSPFSRGVTDQQIQGMERIAPFIGYFAAAQFLIGMPVVALIVAGILFAVFNAGMGGGGTFKQAFAVVVHAGPISLLSALFTVPLNYSRGTLSSATNLSILVPMLPETSFVSRLLGTVELFLIWQLFVLSIGLAVLYRRRTQPIATALLVVYAIIALIIVFVRGRAGA